MNIVDRLLEGGMTTLEERRHQADMTMMFKVLKGVEDVDMADWFTVAVINFSYNASILKC